MHTSFVSWDTEADQSQRQSNLALLPQPGVLLFTQSHLHTFTVSPPDSTCAVVTETWVYFVYIQPICGYSPRILGFELEKNSRKLEISGMVVGYA